MWRAALSSLPEEVFALLDSDEDRSGTGRPARAPPPGGFELEFAGGLTTRVAVLDRQPPTRLAIRYFDSETVLELERRPGGGCLVCVECRCDDPAEWLEFYAGWVSWPLILKAAADYGVDLRNGSDERTWRKRYVDP